MKNKKNKGKKALTAVGAVVAAGLTPGIVAASPMQGANAGITAADVVAINGMAYGFDELFDQQRGEPTDTIEMNIVLQPDSSFRDDLIVVAMGTTKYGARISGVPRAVEPSPQFPGGEAALAEYIQSHIQYPASAIKNQVQGKVVVQAVVREDGEIGIVQVVRPLDKDLDEEAVRVVKSLPKFTPGIRNGKPAPMFITVPVTFNLPQDNND